VRVPLNEEWLERRVVRQLREAGTNYINAIKATSAADRRHCCAPRTCTANEGLHRTVRRIVVGASHCQKPMTDAAQAIRWTSVAKHLSRATKRVVFTVQRSVSVRADNNNSAAGWQCWETGSPATGISYPVEACSNDHAVSGTGRTNVLIAGREEYSNFFDRPAG